MLSLCPVWEASYRMTDYDLAEYINEKKKESHLGDSPDHQGASTSHIMVFRGEGCHPSMEKCNKTLNSLRLVRCL